MIAIGRLAAAGFSRSPLRSGLRVLVLAMSAALLGSMLLFVGYSLRSMTGAATRSVPLDWQGPVASYAEATSAAAAVARQTGVVQASAVATAPFASAGHAATAGSIRTGSGSLLAIPNGYSANLKTFRLLRGRLTTGQVVLDQQLAATLQARLGDTITITPRQGAKPRVFRVSGVALVTAPDLLFQPLNPLLGPAPAQPPAQIVLMPLETFVTRVAPALHALGATSVGSSAVPGAQAGTQWQVQAQLDSTTLGSTPSQALTRAGQVRNRVERNLLGRVQFVDNLSGNLSTAAGDALYAQTLYIMLAVPGALIALGLAYLAALGAAARDRRDLSLLRARGAPRRSLVAFAIVESSILGLAAGLLGAGLAIASTSLLISGGVGLTAGHAATTALACVALAFAGAVAARVGASLAIFGGSIVEGRRRTQRIARPLWQRLYLDLICLGISGLIYWLTARTGFSAVVSPDSNPTLSLSVYMFFAPALLWLGATLLLVRLRGGALAWVARRGAGARATTTRGFLLASAGRRGAAVNRGLIVLGLLLAFGVNLGIFTATYDQQARVDAQLTLGADVVATAPSGAVVGKRLLQRIASVRGVRAVSGVDHSYAYVGPDLQDTYGIDAATLPHATQLRDSYFLGSSARATIGRLRVTRDGVLVSKETITDYSLKVGDLLRLRVLDHASGRFRVVPFHVVGSVQEFPSAPKDSFMVANLAYLSAAAHDGGPNAVFARVGGDPVAPAQRIAAATSVSGTSVRNIREQAQQTVSSITTVDLNGIARIESLFVVLLGATAMGLFVALGLAERRREFATMAALGAPLRQIAAFLWSEAALVLGASFVLAIGLGSALSLMLVAMLQHVFDPPPDALTIPWAFLGILFAAALGASVLACAVAGRGIRRLRLGEILREQ